jgi:hypothetical protein
LLSLLTALATPKDDAAPKAIDGTSRATATTASV